MSKPIIPMVSSVAEGRCHALWSFQPLGPIGCRALQSTTDAAAQPFRAAQAFRHASLGQRPAGYTDAVGGGQTYSFGLDDVRWAATRADVDQFVKAPSEAD